MPEGRLERARRAYDLVIDMWPYGCKLVEVGTQDVAALNAVWSRSRAVNPEADELGEADAE